MVQAAATWLCFPHTTTTTPTKKRKRLILRRAFLDDDDDVAIVSRAMESMRRESSALAWVLACLRASEATKQQCHDHDRNSSDTSSVALMYRHHHSLRSSLMMMMIAQPLSMPQECPSRWLMSSSLVVDRSCAAVQQSPTCTRDSASWWVSTTPTHISDRSDNHIDHCAMIS